MPFPTFLSLVKINKLIDRYKKDPRVNIGRYRPNVLKKEFMRFPSRKCLIHYIAVFTSNTLIGIEL